MLRAEVYLVKVPVVLSDDHGNPNPKKKDAIHCSKYTNVNKMAITAERLYNIPLRSSRLWVYEDDDHENAR